MRPHARVRRLYFRDRTPEDLRKARSHERRVDQAVKAILDERPSLFPEEPR